MAGNAVLLKPSEVTPYSGKLVGDLFREAGLPEGVLTVLLGDGETGAALVDCGVDKIAFTGSVGTGRRVAESCARQLLPCSLELGGKDPMIVCADANIERASGGAVAGGFLNSGQVCFSTERVYVLDSVADEFIPARRRTHTGASPRRRGVRGWTDLLAEAARDHRGPRCRRDRQGCAGAHGRAPQSQPQGPVLRAHGPRERDARYVDHARGNIRANLAHHARA